MPEGEKPPCQGALKVMVPLLATVDTLYPWSIFLMALFPLSTIQISPLGARVNPCGYLKDADVPLPSVEVVAELPATVSTV